MTAQSYVSAAMRLNKSERHLLSLLLVHGEITLASLRQEKRYKSFARASKTLYEKGLLDKAARKGYKDNVPYKVVIIKSNMYSYCVQIPSTTESRCQNAQKTATTPS